MVVTLESIGTTTATYEAVFQFVAFGIKTMGLWGGILMKITGFGSYSLVQWNVP
jgi:hypothetical protein